jgi:hypothetical protein
MTPLPLDTNSPVIISRISNLDYPANVTAGASKVLNPLSSVPASATLLQKNGKVATDNYLAYLVQGAGLNDPVGGAFFLNAQLPYNVMKLTPTFGQLPFSSPNGATVAGEGRR